MTDLTKINVTNTNVVEMEEVIEKYLIENTIDGNSN
jgi:hypothetical protein